MDIGADDAVVERIVKEWARWQPSTTLDAKSSWMKKVKKWEKQALEKAAAAAKVTGTKRKRKG